MTNIYIAYGLPCTGKSTFAKTLANTGIVSSDDLIMTLGKEYGITNYNEAWNVFKSVGNSSTMTAMAEMFISRGMDVFYDRTNLKVDSRKNMVKLAKEGGHRLIGIYFKPSDEVYAKLVASRPDKVVNPLFLGDPSTHEAMTVAEGFDEIYNYNYDTNSLDVIYVSLELL